jgi:hypothetical protein
VVSGPLYLHHADRGAGRPHRNRGLFSDHYLNITLPGRPDWRALAGDATGATQEMPAAARSLLSTTTSAPSAEIEEYIKGLDPYDFQDLVANLLEVMG